MKSTEAIQAKTEEAAQSLADWEAKGRFGQIEDHQYRDRDHQVFFAGWVDALRWVLSAEDVAS